MSSAPAPAPATSPSGIPTPPKREITLISHSMLFYWWPIWVLGFIMATITYFDNTRLAIVPPDSKLIKKGESDDRKITTYELVVLNPPNRPLDPPTRSLGEAE